jgi:carbamoyl-phosphate synthase large subunit
VFKVNEGRPNVVDEIKRGAISLIINTPLGRSSYFDEQAIRRAALQYNVACVTTMTGAHALVEAIGSWLQDGYELSIYSLQELDAMKPEISSRFAASAIKQAAIEGV